MGLGEARADPRLETTDKSKEPIDCLGLVLRSKAKLDHATFRLLEDRMRPPEEPTAPDA